MADSTRSGGRNSHDDVFPMSLELDGSGHDPGSMYRLGAAWGVRTDPLAKLALIYIAGSGVRPRNLAPLAEFASCTIARAEQVLHDLHDAGYVR